MQEKRLALICMRGEKIKNKAPVARWDNKTTEEEKEEDAGWEESAASLIISEKTERRKTLPIGTRLINKVLSERNPGQKRMVRFNIPQRLSSKLKPRLLNASEIIIMRARVTAGGLCLSLTVDVRLRDREEPPRIRARVHTHTWSVRETRPQESPNRQPPTANHQPPSPRR